MKELQSSNDDALKKGNGNNGIKPYFTSIYSEYFDDYQIYGSFPIPNTNMGIFASYPTDGEDRAHVVGEWINGNWNIKGPRIFVVDWDTGLVKYSNWCDDVRDGHGQQRSRGKLIELDFSGDGETDVWTLDPHGVESDYTAQSKTTLNDALLSDPYYFPTPGNCGEETTRVDIDIKVHIKNGIWHISVVLDGVKYTRTYN